MPVVPAYTDFIDHSVTGQEDLLLAFSELFVAPNSRHVFAFALAAFIDVIVFLLAYASGPFFFGAPEQRWLSGGAALDSVDEQIFVRDFLRKLSPGARGMPHVEISTLSPCEQQLCLVLVARGMAAPLKRMGRSIIFWITISMSTWWNRWLRGDSHSGLQSPTRHGNLTNVE